jgi:hypothetical protein
MRIIVVLCPIFYSLLVLNKTICYNPHCGLLQSFLKMGIGFQGLETAYKILISDEWLS